MKIRLFTRLIIGAVSGHLPNTVLSIRGILNLIPKKLYFEISLQKHKQKNGHLSETHQFMFYRKEKNKTKLSESRVATNCERGLSVVTIRCERLLVVNSVTCQRILVINIGKVLR